NNWTLKASSFIDQSMSLSDQNAVESRPLLRPRAWSRSSRPRAWARASIGGSSGLATYGAAIESAMFDERVAACGAAPGSEPFGPAAGVAARFLNRAKSVIDGVKCEAMQGAAFGRTFQSERRQV